VTKIPGPANGITATVASVVGVASVVRAASADIARLA
jgi:hypothetical protein